MSEPKRIRVIQYVVQPTIVVDDGDTLEPLQIQPITVSAREWAQFVEHGLGDALARLQMQVNQPPVPDEQPVDPA